MSDRKISAHPSGTTLDGTEVLLVNQDGDTVKILLSDLVALLGIIAGAPPSGAAGGDLTGTYPNPTIGSGKITTAKFQASAKAPYAGAADTATLATTATTANAVAANGVDTAAIQASAVTLAKMADMTGPAVLGRSSGTGAPQSVSMSAIVRSLALCLPFGSAHQLSSTQPASNDAPYVARTGCMYHIGQGNVAFKTDSIKGLVTALTPSTLSGGTRGGAIYLGDALHKVLFWGSGGFITMDVDTDVFDTLVAPTSWGQISAAYHVGSGYVYYASTDKPRRCLLDGTSNSAGDTVTGTPSRVCIIGDLLFVEDDTGAGASKIWKYDLSVWPTRGAAVTLGGDMTLYAGLAYHSGLGYLIIGDYNGQLLIVNPTTLATVATVVLSGAAARAVQHLVYDATVDRIFAVDTAGKVYVIDGTSFAVIGYCLPVGGVSVNAFATAGLTYDGDRGLLSVRCNASTEVHRFRA